MEHTEPLKIIIKKDFSEMELAIHPNDGEDLDLYTREHKLFFYAGKSIDKFKSGEGQLGNVELHLLNECKLGTIMISNGIYNKLKPSEKAILVRDKDKILLTFK